MGNAQDKLCNAPTLAFPDFTKPFILYVDGSKKKAYGVALYQISTDGIQRPVLFLSRDLSDAKTRYWSTELEVGALVWALMKLSQYFDDGEFTVITDHIALKSALQNKTSGRRSNRLNEWALYLSTFQPRMKIIHRARKSHGNADGLSRISTGEDDDLTELFPVAFIWKNEISYDFINRQISLMPDKIHACLDTKGKMMVY